MTPKEMYATLVNDIWLELMALPSCQVAAAMLRAKTLRLDFWAHSLVPISFHIFKLYLDVMWCFSNNLDMLK